jgi:phage terminase small subunit
LSEEIQEKPVKKLRRPTLKQEEFAREYVANGGNGTQAALKVYDVETEKTAQALASENLSKPIVETLVNGFKRETLEALDAGIKECIAIAHQMIKSPDELRDGMKLTTEKHWGMKYLADLSKTFAPSQKPPSKINNLNLFKMPKRD